MRDTKATLVDALERLNQAVLAKLEGVDEYDLRRPITPTGTNLAGVVKHLASVQAAYFGAVFGRPWPEPMPWFSAEADINDDMFLSATESTEWVKDFYRRTWSHAVDTIKANELTSVGTVEWWPEDRRHPTLDTVLIHMIVETSRHAGHLDIVRELIDGSAGRFDGDPSMPGEDEIDWSVYAAKVESAARAAQGHTTENEDRDGHYVTPLGEPDPQQLARFWDRFCAATNRPDTPAPGAWCFGDTVELADELIDLVVDGPKRATAGAVAEYESEGEAIPQVGDLSIVMDGAMRPRAVLETTDVRIGPLSSVDDRFAWDEGEGDRSRTYWLDAHHWYFARSYARLGLTFHPDIPVVFERFDVVYTE